MADRLREILNDAFLTRHNSLAGYIVSCEPYVAPGSEKTFAAVEEISKMDAAERDEILEFMTSRELVPHVVPPSNTFTEYNYLSISYLAKVLEEELTRDAERCEKWLAQVSESAVKNLFERLLERNRAKLQMVRVQ